MRCQFTRRPRTNCRFSLACDGEGSGASPGRESSRLTGDGQGQLGTPYCPPMPPPWRQERGAGWVSEFSPVQAGRARRDGGGDEPPLAAVGPTVSPGHHGVSGAFLSMYTRHASLSTPGILLSLFTGKDATPREGGGPERGPRLHTPKSRKCHGDAHFLPPPRCGHPGP